MNDTDEFSMIRRTVRGLVDKEVRPIAAELDEKETPPWHVYNMMADLGLFGLCLPEGDGGSGLSCLGYTIVVEELSRGYASVADYLGLVDVVSTLLSRYGSAEQKARYLAPVLRGKLKCAFAVTESEAGSDLSGIRTIARPNGDGWVLDGSKLWIHNAPHCDFAIVLARTSPEKGKRGMSLFIVERIYPGFESGPKEHKMGQRASNVGGLTFDGVVLPATALLGEQDRGFHAVMSVLEKGRIYISALCVGILQAALDASITQAKIRHQFSRPIAEFQGVQWMLADMAKDTHAARLMTQAAAIAYDTGARANLECSMAKCFASDAAVQHTANAVQIFGGSGYIRGYEVERLYRDAKITQIYEGTNQIQRMLIARALVAGGDEGPST
jgi:alkylation response protein AidB-like acyl-CoA dehydrogenase